MVEYVQVIHYSRNDAVSQGQDQIIYIPPFSVGLFHISFLCVVKRGETLVEFGYVKQRSMASMPLRAEYMGSQSFNHHSEDALLIRGSLAHQQLISSGKFYSTNCM